jgi:hypothetical protein
MWAEFVSITTRGSQTCRQNRALMGQTCVKLQVLRVCSGNREGYFMKFSIAATFTSSVLSAIQRQMKSK